MQLIRPLLFVSHKPHLFSHLFTVIFRSITEPVRNIGFRKVDHFHLSRAVSLDINSRTIRCHSLLVPNNEYTLPYDYLVIGVGALSNTYGIPGVEQHACFLKV